MSREVEDAMIRLGWAPSKGENVWLRTNGDWHRALVVKIRGSDWCDVDRFGSSRWRNGFSTPFVPMLRVRVGHLRPRVGDRIQFDDEP